MQTIEVRTSQRSFLPVVVPCRCSGSTFHFVRASAGAGAGPGSAFRFARAGAGSGSAFCLARAGVGVGSAFRFVCAGAGSACCFALGLVGRVLRWCWLWSGVSFCPSGDGAGWAFVWPRWCRCYLWIGVSFSRCCWLWVGVLFCPRWCRAGAGGRRFVLPTLALALGRRVPFCPCKCWMGVSFLTPKKTPIQHRRQPAPAWVQLLCCRQISCAIWGLCWCDFLLDTFFVKHIIAQN